MFSFFKNAREKNGVALKKKKVPRNGIYKFDDKFLPDSQHAIIHFFFYIWQGKKMEIHRSDFVNSKFE